MNAIELLKNDHRHVLDLFDQCNQATFVSEKKRIFPEIKYELDIHMQVEETMFYPLFSEREDFRELIDEAYDQHQEIRDTLDEMETMADDNDFDNRLDDLMDIVEDHIGDEEAEMFPKVKDAFDSSELDQLGEQLEEEKETISHRLVA